METPTPETDSLPEINRLFGYLEYVAPDAPRNLLDPYQISADGGYSFQDLRKIRDHARKLERERDAALAELQAEYERQAGASI